VAKAIDESGIEGTEGLKAAVPATTEIIQLFVDPPMAAASWTLAKITSIRELPLPGAVAMATSSLRWIGPDTCPAPNHRSRG
jgi:hypothetical protein